MTDKPNYYAIIPANVRYADITPNAKLLYAEITSFLQMNGVCFATNRYFSKLYGKNKVTISRWIKELRDGGFIKVTFTYKEGTKEIDNRYIEICKEGISKVDKRVLTKMLKNNNTSNNTNTTYSNKGRFKNKMKDWKACIRTWEKRQNVNKGMSKIHQHLQKNLNVKEKLKKQFKK